MVSKGLVARIVSLKQRVEEKRQQDQARQHRGEVLFSVAVVVLEMVAFGLERIVVLVLDFPAAAPSSHHGDDMSRVDGL